MPNTELRRTEFIQLAAKLVVKRLEVVVPSYRKTVQKGDRFFAVMNAFLLRTCRIVADSDSGTSNDFNDDRIAAD